MKVILAALLLLPTLLVPPTSAGAAEAPRAVAPAAAPTHTLKISGAGIATYPTFDAGVERYGITTTDASTGTVTVTARTSDTKGRVFIDGRLAPTGTRTVSGLQVGDEVSVIFKDSGGTAAHSAIYLPAGMHALERRGTGPAPTEHTLLTLSLFADGAPFYEVAVDANGVPVSVREEATSAMDFKRHANGQLTVFRESAAGEGRTGSALVVLGNDLQEEARYETVGLLNTDPHDAILLDDSMYLVAYEPNADTGLTDAVIQHRDLDGNVLWEWNSGDHVDPAAETIIGSNNPDYAHINSIQVMADGDILASFRHFSSAFKIARTAHDGFDEGDIVWRFGGRFSDFAFTDEEGAPDGGPCAQHTVSQLDNGHLVVFDNGSWTDSGELCVDPADPTGPTRERRPTRITEYSLDEVADQATLEWSFADPARFAIFAGSSERLDNGNTLIGWASAMQTGSVVTEVTAAGDTAWELVDETPQPPDGTNVRPFTYRAARATIADAIAPVVKLPVSNGVRVHKGQVVRPAFACTDRGGSSLHSCEVSGITGDHLDTSRVGTHQVTVTATDGAGNTSSESRTYVVVADRPDAMLKRAGGSWFRGNNVYGGPARQSVTQDIRRVGRTATTVVRIQNDGKLADRMRINGTRGNTRFVVNYYVGTRRVTGSVVAGTLRSPVLAPGRYWNLQVKVTRTKRAYKGTQKTVQVSARATHNTTRDTVAVLNRAR